MTAPCPTFASSFPRRLLVPMAIDVLAADPCFIDFDFTLKLLDSTTHRAAQAMTHEPASAVVGAGVFAEYRAMNL